MAGRLLSTFIFAALGWRMGAALPFLSTESSYMPWGLASTLTGALFGAVLGPYLTYKPLSKLLDQLARIPSSTIIAGTLGLIIALVISALLSIPLSKLDGWLSWGIPFIISVVLGVFGILVGVQREREFRRIIPGEIGDRHRSSKGHQIILVDTSAIIDGRIADLSRTGFVQGTLVIPSFVLDELRHVADSADSMRRTRGRRGLEILSTLRKDGDLPIQILNIEMINGEVDGELVQLARKMEAQILTTDFNLNRVAELHGVNVLNVNELANSLKPVVLPGEDLAINIMQEGKEPGQGVAFLDDGTMIVVEGGRRFINSVQDVTVTRVLQTAAGRIIFAQLREVY